jgi:hypothetical protein
MRRAFKEAHIPAVREVRTRPDSTGGRQAGLAAVCTRLMPRIRRKALHV